MPFTAIPHNSRLFLDFLFQFEKVEGFYAHRPHSQAVLEYARKLATGYAATDAAPAAGARLMRAKLLSGTRQRTPLRLRARG